MNVVVI